MQIHTDAVIEIGYKTYTVEGTYFPSHTSPSGVVKHYAEIDSVQCQDLELIDTISQEVAEEINELFCKMAYEEFRAEQDAFE